MLDPLDNALNAAASTAFRFDPAVGQANLATVEATTAGIRSGVEITSAGNSYTLASSTSPLVLTVQNNLPYDVPVRVEISGGERVGLTVTDPEIQVVPAGRSQQVKIPAEVTRSGQFQVDAQLVGADGADWGPPVQLSVESTAYGALTVIIIIVAGGVLGTGPGIAGLRSRSATCRGRARDDRTGSARPRAAEPGDGPTRSCAASARRRPANLNGTNWTDAVTWPGHHLTPPDTGSTRHIDRNRSTRAAPTPSTRPATPHRTTPPRQVDDVAGMKTARTGGVVRAGAVMAVATLVSRMTGFLSKVVLLGVLGFGIVNDAYTLANTLPNIVFELLIGGVLTSVAIPLLSRARSDPDGGELLHPATDDGGAGRPAGRHRPGGRWPRRCSPTSTCPATSTRSTQDLANSLAYLLLPQIFFYGIAALFGAILNTKEKFGVPAWAPVANNLVVIGVGIALLFMPSAASADRRGAHLADPRVSSCCWHSAPPRAS